MMYNNEKTIRKRRIYPEVTKCDVCGVETKALTDFYYAICQKCEKKYKERDLLCRIGMLMMIIEDLELDIEENKGKPMNNDNKNKKGDPNLNKSGIERLNINKRIAEGMRDSDVRHLEASVSDKDEGKQ